MAKRFVLTIRTLAWRTRRAVGDPAEDLLLLLGACPEARLLAQVDGAPLDLVEHVVDGGLIARAGRPRMEDLAVDAQGDLGDMCVGRAAVLLVRELDDRIRPVVQHPLDSLELALRIRPHPLGDFDVLALDDRFHAPPLDRRSSDGQYSRGEDGSRSLRSVGPGRAGPGRSGRSSGMPPTIALQPWAPRGMPPTIALQPWALQRHASDDRPSALGAPAACLRRSPLGDLHYPR